MDYGRKIAYLRKSRGMTQEELGRVLNVTYQAVSKWERDESQPDFTTMSEIARFFGVPLSFFVDGEESAEPLYREPAREPENYIGVCTDCGKMLKEEEVFKTSPRIICKECARRKREEIDRRRKADADAARYKSERQRQYVLGKGFDSKLIKSLIVAGVFFVFLAVVTFTMDFKDVAIGAALLLFFFPLTIFGLTHAIIDFINDFKISYSDPYGGYKRNLSLIIGAGFAVANIIVFVVIYLLSDDSDVLIALPFAAIFSFTFVSQFLWGGAIHEAFTAGGFTFKMPGFIISLSLDSFLLMIILKIFLGILALFIFLFTAALMALISIFASPIFFIPSIIRKSAKDRNAKLSE